MLGICGLGMFAILLSKTMAKFDVIEKCEKANGISKKKGIFMMYLVANAFTNALLVKKDPIPKILRMVNFYFRMVLYSFSALIFTGRDEDLINRVIAFFISYVTVIPISVIYGGIMLALRKTKNKVL